MLEAKLKKDGTIKIKEKYRLSVGSVRRISPSQGCLGIESGIIKVVALGTRDDMKDPTYDFQSWDYNADGTEHPIYWVKYQYTKYDREYSVEELEQNILPLEEFLNHTSLA